MNPVTNVLTEAFANSDPVFRWLLLDHTPGAVQEAKLHQLLTGFTRAAALNDAVFAEAGGDFGCVAILMPPGKRVDNPWTMLQAGLIPAMMSIGVGGFKRAVFEYSDVTHAMLPQVFTKEELKKYWYIFIIGTKLDRRRQGLASALLRHAQETGRKDGAPLWLEATTESSRDLYVKHGFKVVGEIVLGEGKVERDGLPKRGGEGVTIWGMYWRP